MKLNRDFAFSLIVGFAFFCIFSALGVYVDSKVEPDPPKWDVVAIDGCEYLKGGGLLAHKGDCMNPIHWGHVIRDTSWYWKVRASEMESNSGIHIQK